MLPWELKQKMPTSYTSGEVSILSAESEFSDSTNLTARLRCDDSQGFNYEYIIAYFWGFVKIYYLLHQILDLAPKHTRKRTQMIVLCIVNISLPLLV